MTKLTTLTLGGKTYDSFPDQEARENIQKLLDNPPVGIPGKDGQDGKDGVDGQTPYIKDGNWWIGETDTGVKAEGVDGQNGQNGADGQDGTPGKSAYAYAQDGGYTGSESEFAAKLASENPTALPNPNKLTINGKEYDGSEAVSITITGGATNENVLLGQTPITLTEPTAVRLVGTGEYSYTVKGKTIADISTSDTTNNGATFKQEVDYLEAVATQNEIWYDSYINFAVNNLTVGASYILCTKGMGIDDPNKITNGYFVIKSSGGQNLGSVSNEGTGTNSVEFTATDGTINIQWYPASNYYWNLGFRTARVSDIYLNEAKDGTERTPVINKSGTFTDTFSLGLVGKGVTISTNPVCEVYQAVSSGDESVTLPLSGKTVVCFGDSLFGMYTGDTSAPAYVAKRTGATVHNVGFSGCRMAVHPTNGYNEFCMYALATAIANGDWSLQDSAASKGSSNFPEQLSILKGIDFADVDYVVIHYGTNDFTAGSSGVSIDNAENPTDYNTLCGALRYSVETLLTAYPKLRIFVSLPAFRFWSDEGTVSYPDTYTNGSGKKLTDFAEALIQTAKEYNLPIIDSYGKLGVNKVNATTFLADGVHHNLEGRKRFGDFIGACLIAECSN